MSLTDVDGKPVVTLFGVHVIGLECTLGDLETRVNLLRRNVYR